MSFFMSKPVEEQKVLSLPALTKTELASAVKLLPYALPGMVSLTSKSQNQKGKRNRKGHLSVPKMISPEQAMMSNNTFNIIQTTRLSRITASTTIEVDGAYNFTFSQINQYTELTAVFDQYRFKLIEIEFHPTIQALAVASQSGLFFTAVDTDDSGSTTAASIRDYPGCISSEVFKPHKHTWEPHVAIAAYAGAFTSFANETSPWIDVASPSVQHYGLKYAFEVMPIAFTYDPIVRIHVQLRNVR